MDGFQKFDAVMTVRRGARAVADAHDEPLAAFCDPHRYQAALAGRRFLATVGFITMFCDAARL